MAKFRYDDSDMASVSPVSVAEINFMLTTSAKSIRWSPSKLRHFLTRLRATLQTYRNAERALQKHISQLNDRISRAGTATTLNPLDALRWLDDAQMDALFDRLSRQQLATLRRLVAEAGNTQARQEEYARTLRDAAQQLLQSPELDMGARAKAAEIAAKLRAEPPKTNHPGMLDYPEIALPPALPPAPTPALPPAPPPALPSGAGSGKEANPPAVWKDPFGVE